MTEGKILDGEGGCREHAAGRKDGRQDSSRKSYDSYGKSHGYGYGYGCRTSQKETSQSQDSSSTRTKDTEATSTSNSVAIVQIDLVAFESPETQRARGSSKRKAG
jgi:hypothetical protein